MTGQEFDNLIAQGIVLFDGAMGSNLMKQGMPKGVSTEVWLSQHPQIQQELQRGYVDAGSQIILAPTFQLNRSAMEEFQYEGTLQDLINLMVSRAKKAADGRALVAGDISGTGRAEQGYDVMLDIYKEQITYLVEAGVDLLVAETMVQTEETMAAIDAALAVCDLPIICTMTVEADGSLLMGGNVYEAVAVYEAMGAAAVGINCSLGPDQLEAIVRGIRQTVSIPVVVKPNAGIPYIDDNGQAVYNMGAEEFAGHMMKLIDAGANIIGGCCGTDPTYIRAIKERLR